MVDAAVIAAKLRELAGRIDRVAAHRPADAESLAQDRDALDLQRRVARGTSTSERESGLGGRLASCFQTQL